MAFKVLVREEARNDILKASYWYESRQTGLGEKFLLVVDHHINYLTNNPEAFPVKKAPFRELIMNEFPYVLIYTFDKRKITVFAVFHTSRNPNKKP